MYKRFVFACVLLGVCTAEASSNNPAPSLASAYPCKTKHGFMLGADFLAWKICQSDMDYAFERPETAFSATEFGQRYTADLGWQAGFRLHAGYQFGCDGWVVSANYTFFHPSTTNALHVENLLGDELLLNWGIISVLPAPAYEEVRLHTEHKYDVVDLMFSRPTYLSCSYIVTPYFGARGLWLHQDFLLQGLNADVSDYNVEFTSELSGGGLHVGMRHEMLFCGSWSIFGDFGVSMISAHTKDKLLDTENPEVTPVVNAHVLDEHDLCLPGADLIAGVHWYNQCNCFLIDVNIGYEMAYWWNIPTVRRYSEIAGNIDPGTSNTASKMMLQGITLNMNLYF